MRCLYSSEAGNRQYRKNFLHGFQFIFTMFRFIEEAITAKVIPPQSRRYHYFTMVT